VNSSEQVLNDFQKDKQAESDIVEVFKRKGIKLSNRNGYWIIRKILLIL
jgi:hypothetical protein